MGWFILLSLLLSGSAGAMDLGALRAAHPGQDLVVLEQNTVFELVDGGTLRESFDRRVAILQDGGRERLALFEQIARPGCREPGGIQVTVTSRDGSVRTLDESGLVRIARGSRALDATSSTETLKGPRPGLEPGALLEERWFVDYPPGCYAGLTSARRSLGNAWGPVLLETVAVRCAGSGCHAVLDRALPESLEVTGDGLLLRRTNVPAPSAESWSPSRARPQVFVSSSDDPLALGQLLASGLGDAVKKASRRVGSYAAEARKRLPGESDSTVRLARHLRSLNPFGGGIFWSQGFRWGDPPASGDGRLNQLEWWALANAALASAGGVPVVLDRESHLPQPGIGNITGYQELGVLVPGRFLVTPRRFVPLTGDGAAELASRQIMRLDGEPRIVTLPSSASLDSRSWSGEVELLSGNYLRYDLRAELRGEFGGELRRRFGKDRQWWKDRKKRKKTSWTEVEWKRRWLGDVLMSREVAVGEVEPDPKRLDALDLRVVYTHEGMVQLGEGVMALGLPLPVSPALADVVATADRELPLALRPIDESFDLLIKPPEGYRAGSLPAARSIEEGPVSVELSWLPEGRNARMRLRYRVSEAFVNPARAESVGRAADLLRDATRAWVVFVKE